MARHEPKEGRSPAEGKWKEMGGRGEFPEKLVSHGTPPRLNHERNAHPGEAVGPEDENGRITEDMWARDRAARD